MIKKTAPEQSSSDKKSALPDSVPLFVDLDGTLIKTDLLIESAFLLLKNNRGCCWLCCTGWHLVGLALNKK